MPIQNDEYWLVDEQPVTVGTIHEPLTSVTELRDPVTAYPLQFELVVTLLRRSRMMIGTCRCNGAASRTDDANGPASGPINAANPAIISNPPRLTMVVNVIGTP